MAAECNEEVDAELAALRERLGRLENVLKAIYGEGVLGGPAPAAPVEPEPAARLRPIATVGAQRMSGFFSG